MFVIELSTRRVSFAGLAVDPGESRVKQALRNQLDAQDGFLLGKRCPLMDRDPLYSQALLALLRASGVKPVRLSPRSPNLNAYAKTRAQCSQHLKSTSLPEGRCNRRFAVFCRRLVNAADGPRLHGDRPQLRDLHRCRALNAI